MPKKFFSVLSCTFSSVIKRDNCICPVHTVNAGFYVMRSREIPGLDGFKARLCAKKMSQAPKIIRLAQRGVNVVLDRRPKIHFFQLETALKSAKTPFYTSIFIYKFFYLTTHTFYRRDSLIFFIKTEEVNELEGQKVIHSNVLSALRSFDDKILKRRNNKHFFFTIDG